MRLVLFLYMVYTREQKVKRERVQRELVTLWRWNWNPDFLIAKPRLFLTWLNAFLSPYLAETAQCS